MSGKKQLGYSDFTTKVLSLSQSRTKLINPFPKDIHHLLATFVQLSYYSLIFPYHFVYNKVTNQYDLRSNIVQKVLYYLLQSMTITILFLEIARIVLFTSTKGPLTILGIFGLFGHFFNVGTYLGTIHYYKESIRDLLNFFVACVPPPPSEESFGGLGSPIQTISYSKEGNHQEDGESVQNPDPSMWGTVRRQLKIMLAFRNIAVLFWLYAIQQGFVIGFFELLSDWIYLGVVPFIKTSGQYKYVIGSLLPPGFADLPPPLGSIVDGVIVFFMAFDRFRYFNAGFIFTLEIAVAVTVTYIANHFTSIIYNAKDYWKPSSNNVLYSLLIVRQAYRMINRIFGWMMLYTLMGEFPNITFFVVNFYLFPESTLQWNFQAALLNELILLAVSTWAVQEMSKVKEWFHVEEKGHWAMMNKGSLQRKIVLFELSLDKYALSAHGFFQLSLPAFISIVSGVLSNALIIIQLDLSSRFSSTPAPAVKN